MRGSDAWEEAGGEGGSRRGQHGAQQEGPVHQTGWGMENEIKARGARSRRESEEDRLRGAGPLGDQGKHCRKFQRKTRENGEKGELSHFSPTKERKQGQESQRG